MKSAPPRLAKWMAEAAGIVALLAFLAGESACSVQHRDHSDGARATTVTLATERSAYIEFLWNESDWAEPPAPRPISIFVKDAQGTVVAEARAEPEDALPGFWREVSHANPFFYMIDGFRYGFFAASDIAPGVSVAVVAAAFVAVAVVCLLLLKSGYRLRS